MWGVVPVSTTNLFQMPLRQVERLPSDHLLYGMVTCHSITIMSGEMKGDPLDLKMFESTGWMLEEANVSDATKYDLLFPTIVRPPKAQRISNSKCATASPAGRVHSFLFPSQSATAAAAAWTRSTTWRTAARRTTSRRRAPS